MSNKADELSQIGLRLSNCRQNRNMTQEELAMRLGITPQAVSKWERALSFPDISMLSDIARLLDVSTDWLLGLCPDQMQQPELSGTAGSEKSKMQQVQLEMDNRLRNCIEPLELVFGREIVPVFMGDDSFMEQIRELKKQLANEGICTPVIRVRDLLSLGEKEFMVLSFHNILYSEVLDSVNEGTVVYMIGKLGDVIRDKYHEILYPDLVKCLVDNLKIRYPALIEDIVPEKISYGLLTETVKLVLADGISICYLPKMIEIMECVLRRAPGADAEELAAQILPGIRRKDNYFIHSL